MIHRAILGSRDLLTHCSTNNSINITYHPLLSLRERPIMIHRAILGSLERFFGVLTENYAGAFPLWLAPVQVRILPITDKQDGYAKKVLE